jgi:hypothetical protein
MGGRFRAVRYTVVLGRRKFGTGSWLVRGKSITRDKTTPSIPNDHNGGITDDHLSIVRYQLMSCR